ncbi:UNVERIFIED_CONTAM: hypothetical protein GTU68_051775 [Idotea baltica]|nr:hypothetical protein [Idotea baltica]
MSDLSFDCLNTGTPTCLHASTGSYTCIDLSFVSTDALLDFSWDVLRDDFGSDHFPVQLSLIQPSVPCNLATEISRSVGEFESTTECLEYLEQTIITAAIKNIPRTKNERANKVHWWTPGCTSAIRENKRGSRRYYRTRLPAHRIEMRQKKGSSSANP